MWAKIKEWCRGAHTIVFARLQIIFAAVWAVLTVTDLAPLLGPKWIVVWLLFSGIVTEYLRRLPGKTDL